MDWLSGAISGVAGLGSSLINYYAQEEANEANKQLAKANRAFYQQQWMRENAYNDPSAQMARLQAAGLNPSLMYGDGASGLQGSASMAEVDAARVAAPQLDPLMMAQIANLTAQTEKTKTETKKTEEEIDLTKAQADFTRGQIKVGETVAMYNLALTDLTKDQQKKITAEIEALGAQVALANSNIQKNAAQINAMDEQTKIAWFNSFLKSEETEALCAKYAAETDFTKEQMKYYAAMAIAKINNIKSDTALNEAKKGLTDKQAQEVDQAISNMKIQGDQMQFDFLQNKRYDSAMREVEISSKLAGAINDVYSGNFLFRNTRLRQFDNWREEYSPGASGKF